MTVPINVPRRIRCLNELKNYTSQLIQRSGPSATNPVSAGSGRSRGLLRGIGRKKICSFTGTRQNEAGFQGQNTVDQIRTALRHRNILALSNLEIITLVDGSLRARSISKAPQKTPPMTNSFQLFPRPINKILPICAGAGQISAVQKLCFCAVAMLCLISPTYEQHACFDNHGV